MFAQKLLRSLTLSFVVVCATLVVAAGSMQAAHADTLSISATSHTFYVTASNLFVRTGETVSFTHTADQGGNLNGILNGVALTGTYCVNLTNPINIGTYDTTVVTHDGATFGETIMNGGQIAWLMKNFAASALSVDEQNGLQAAIWRTEYGSNFQVDGADNATTGNSAAMITAYQTYRTALGSNTASVSDADLYWLSPDKSTGTAPTVHRQGLIGYKASAAAAVPEAGTLALLLPVLGVVGMTVIRRKK